MGWSKVNHKYSKPFKWWLHKILCEIGWLRRRKDNYEMYHQQLTKLCKTGFNLYGNKILAFMFLLFLAGCYTDKKAQKQLDKALMKKPDLVAAIARNAFPCIVIKTDTTIVTTDTTINVDCPPDAKEYFTIRDTLNKTDTLWKTKRVTVTLPIQTKIIVQRIEDSAKIKLLVGQMVRLQIKNDALQGKLEKRNKWVLWLAIFAGLVVAWKIIKWRLNTF